MSNHFSDNGSSEYAMDMAVQWIARAFYRKAQMEKDAGGAAEAMLVLSHQAKLHIRPSDWDAMFKKNEAYLPAIMALYPEAKAHKEAMDMAINKLPSTVAECVEGPNGELTLKNVRNITVTDSDGTER